MPNYTVEDSATGRKITFEWKGTKPPTEDDMLEIFAEARSQESEQPIQEQPSTLENMAGGALETAENIGKVYPMAETAANLVTSSYGVPISGLAGLFALPWGLDKAKGVVEDVQKALVYQPQTEGGKQLAEVTTYPLQKLDQVGGYVGGKLEEAGYPNLGATAHTAIAGAPAIVAGAKIGLKPSPAKALAKVDAELTKTINVGINKSIRPSVVKKEIHGQVRKYRRQARTTVEEIIKNRDNLNMIDESGAKVSGLPKTVDQFAQAIEQTKRSIFEKYDALAKETQTVGVKVDLNAIGKELDIIINSRPMQNHHPSVVKYAKSMKAKLVEQIHQKQVNTGIVDAYGRPITRIQKTKTGQGHYTAMETQEAIQMSNRTLKEYYRNPTPNNSGKAYVDAMIANRLRKNLDVAIEQVTGKDYQALKNKYGAMRTIESDVTKRSIVDARKNIKGLIDFSDVYTGYHIVKGILAAEPSTVAGGVAAKGIARYMKWRNEPNRIVKNMFEDTEKLLNKREALTQ